MTKKFDPKSCSVLNAADCIGIHRNTLAKWLEEGGAPFIERAEGNKPWIVSVPDLVAWKIEIEKLRAVDAALKKLSPGRSSDEALDDALDDSRIDIDEAKRRKAVADAIIREIQLDKEAGRVVPIESVAALVAREYAAVREGILGIGPRVAPRIVGQPDAAVIAEEIRHAVDDCLAELNADVKRDWQADGE